MSNINTSCKKCYFAQEASSEKSCEFYIPEAIAANKKIEVVDNYNYIHNYLCKYGLSKDKADEIADRFYQNTYVRIPNPMGFLKLEIRQPVQKTYSDWKSQWVESFKGIAYEAARRLSLDSATEIMSAPESEELHWLLPELRDANKPWPMVTPTGDQKGAGTEWDRLSKLHKAANWEINCALTPIDSGSRREPDDD